jgi:hypothetical protein
MRGTTVHDMPKNTGDRAIDADDLDRTRVVWRGPP